MFKKKKIFMGLLLIVLVSGQGQEKQTGSYCYSANNERPQSKQYGTKTAYVNAKGSFDKEQFEMWACYPTSIWLISRHGTRLPGSEEIKMFQLLNQIKMKILNNQTNVALCPQDLELIRNWNWNPNITPEIESYLTDEGFNELKALAQDYKSIFPALFSMENSSKMYFAHTDSERTKSSYEAFSEGIFGRNHFGYAHLHDKYLKPYKDCTGWKNEENFIINNSTSEYNKFRNSEIYKQLIQNVTKRLGLTETIEIGLIEVMWDMCRYEQAWNVALPSAWCVAFTPDDVYILEYAQDLKYFYSVGNGSKYAAQLPCEIIKNMLSDVMSQSEDKQTVKAYFTHSTTINQILTRFKLFDETSKNCLQANNITQIYNRNFFVSKRAPFASNLAAIQYRCPFESTYKYKFVLNQKIVNLPLCNNQPTCLDEDLKIIYDSYLEINCENKLYCNFANQICISVALLILIVLKSLLF